MFRIFPRLEERADTAAGVLSGGEQQMLTMCRTRMGNPDLIMIDNRPKSTPGVVAAGAAIRKEWLEVWTGVRLLAQKRQNTFVLRV